MSLVGTALGVPLFGEEEIAIDLATDLPLPTSVVLYVNGSPSNTGEVFKDEEGQWWAFWDTSTIGNGNHVLQVAHPYIVPSIYGVGIPKVALGAPCLVNVANPIQFDAINDGFTSALFINGILQMPITSYSIEIYTADQNHTLLTNLTGVPMEGEINESWDFTSEEIEVDGGLECQIAFPSNPEVPQPVVKHYSMERCFPGNGFTLGWGWNGPVTPTPAEASRRGTWVRTALVDMLGMESEQVPEFDLYPPVVNGNGNQIQTASFRFDGSQAAHDALTNSISLTDSVNFFYWGHGFSEGLSCNLGLKDPPDAVRYEEIADILGNPKVKVSSSGTSRSSYKYNHCYRFVFMDACGTYSKQMVQAFGIPFSPMGSGSTVAEYVQGGRSPRAFIGWEVAVIGSDISDPSGVCDFYRVQAHQIVLGYWQTGGSISDAMAAWDSYLPDKRREKYGGVYSTVDPNVPDPDRPGHTLGVHPPMKTWKISGCVDLTRYSPFP
jgi:hypothetical protein